MRIKSSICAVNIFFAVSFLGGCGGGGGSSPTPTATYSLSGRVQKGPFATGSQINVNTLDTTLSPTGSEYNTQTTDALGAFSLSSKISYPQVEIVAEGFFFDEISGRLSAAQIPLRTISDLSVNNVPTVNVLTTLQEHRLKTLVANGSSVAAASAQSATEVLSLFGIKSNSINSFSAFDSMRIDGGSDQDSVLLAVSVILSQMATDSAKANGTTEAAELSNLVNTIASGIAANGTLTSSTFIPARNLANTEIDSTTIAANLESYYSNNGETVTAPPFIEWVDQSNSGVLPQRLIPITGLSFTATTTATPGQPATSNLVTVAGAGADVYVKVVASSGTTIIKNGVAVAGQITVVEDGDTLALQVTALGFGQTTTATVTVGSTSLQWGITSVALGGAITGLAGTGLVLQDGLGDTVAVAPGSTSFSFTSVIPTGGSFGISVMAAPTSPLQSCAVSNGSGTVGSSDAPITVACSISSEVAIVPDSTSNNISVYALDPTTGALSPVPGNPFTTSAAPQSVAVDATGRYVIVANEDTSVSVYAVNATDGSLAPVARGPFSNTSVPLSLALDLQSNFAYLFNEDGTISGYSIDSGTGILTALSGSPFATGVTYPFPALSTAFAVDPSGSHLYYAYNYVKPIDASITGALGFTINSTTGDLSAIPENFNFVASPITIAPNGQYAYQRTYGYLLGYSVDASSGAFHSLNGSPFVAKGADAVAIDPTSRFLYVTDDTDITLTAYTINQATGALTSILGSPYVTAGSANCSDCAFLPTFVSVESAGKYVYVESEFTSSSSIITAFGINSANGSLTPVPGSPFTTGANPGGLVGIVFARIPP